MLIKTKEVRELARSFLTIGIVAYVVFGLDITPELINRVLIAVAAIWVGTMIINGGRR